MNLPHLLIRGAGRLAWALAAVTWVGCDDPPAPDCVDWKGDVNPAFATACATCHGGATPQNGYSVEGYLAAIGPGSDAIPNALLGDAESELITVLETDPVHSAFTEEAALARKWIVECRVSWSNAGPHEEGILNPNDTSEFHGARIAEVGFDLSICGDCHGVNEVGGSAGSCLDCHPSGPADCSVCHPATTSGSHAAHADESRFSAGYGCGACHVSPTDWLDAGHIFNADGTEDGPPAEVAFGGKWWISPTDPGTWDGQSRTCTTYCHGDAFDDAIATKPVMNWDEGIVLGCSSCHGRPPQNHVGAPADCSGCHGLVFSGGSISDFTKHIDAETSLGNESGGCAACHGNSASGGAPPPSFAGEVLTTDMSVGAHAAHLNAAMGRQIVCGDCHLRPQLIWEAGHADTPLPAEVFPDLPSVNAVSGADGAVLMWDRNSGTCETYCHGRGAGLLTDTSATLQVPVWNDVGTGQAACGTCHALPPVTATHPASAACGNCHPAPTAVTHVNGVTDF